MSGIKGDLPQAPSSTDHNTSTSPDDSLAAQTVGGPLVPELEDQDGRGSQEAPPPYGDLHNQMQFSQPGFEAGAAVNDVGRISININTKDRRLADLLAPAIERQIRPESPAVLPPAYIPPSLGGQPGQKPPSRLNVVIQIVGSRGDVQPFVALGKVLKDTYGHRVRIATHGTFQSFVEENGLDFFNIGGDPAELMAFMVKHPGLMPGFEAIKSGEITKRRKGIADMLVGCWRSCIESGDGFGPPPRPTNETLDLSAGIPQDDGRDPFVADAIIANPPSFAHIHIAEKLGIPLHMMFTMPWTPTRAFPHPLADIQASNADDVMTKYLTYTLVEMMTWQGLGDVINRFREGVLNLAPLSMIWAPGLLNRLRIPYTYCWSPALIPKPNDWGSNIDISGFYFLDLATTYNPDPELAAFLEAGPPPVYIGFGSIVVDDPNKLTEMIFEAVRYSGARALVSKGWGGIGADELGVPEGVFMLGNVPHDWLFQHVSCVVHHGGAGTTAAGIKAGKPTVVVPFFGDQPFWGAMIARANAGPDPIPYKKLTAEKLAAAINFCLKPETVQQATLYGEKIREEKGTDVGGQSFHNHIDIDSLRCSIAPSRTAVWRVRRSKIRLSPLAAATLIDEGALTYTDLKLYRPRDYNTEDQPPDPISAAACSLVMSASSIGMSIADMPREIFKGRGRSESHPDASSSSLHGSSNPATGDVTPSASASRVDVSQVQTESPNTPATAISPLVTHPAAETHLASEGSSTDVTSSTGSTLTGSSERPTTRASSSQMKDAFSKRDTSPVGVGIDAAVGAGKTVGRVVGTGVKSPMNFCLGLAKGFRNLPRLYNDETIRPVEKVTDIGSGIRVAGREFGFGLYDGISGLVTQPLKGAEKGGAGGLVKGVGKGIGGLIAKPAAGFWGIPAYTMQGVHAQVTKMFIRSNDNYIITSRIIQGQRDFRNSTLEERNDIVTRWNNGSFDLEGFERYKRKERRSQKSRASPERDTTGDPSTEPQLGWLNHRLSLFDERIRDEKTRLHARKDSWKKGFRRPATASSSGSSHPPIPEDAEFERAIQASVKETSRGNADEDAAVEAAIRQSVNVVRQRGQLPEPARTVFEKDPSVFNDAAYQITDEEYQDLIEQAIKESIAAQSGHESLSQESGIMAASTKEPMGTTGEDHATNHPQDEYEDLKKAIEESKNALQNHPQSPHTEEDLARAIEASREEAERERSQRTEEEIVMEYVKKQSLAEEEFRRQQNKGKGKDSGNDGGDDDEDLKRAMEESLRMSRGDDSGPSGA